MTLTRRTVPTYRLSALPSGAAIFVFSPSWLAVAVLCAPPAVLVSQTTT